MFAVTVGRTWETPGGLVSSPMKCIIITSSLSSALIYNHIGYVLLKTGGDKFEYTRKWSRDCYVKCQWKWSGRLLIVDLFGVLRLTCAQMTATTVVCVWFKPTRTMARHHAFVFAAITGWTCETPGVLTSYPSKLCENHESAVGNVM
nr:hypothetical protein [Tanacetum cinerariifolium]